MERGIFRIIDANFNRGREAVRLIEEFCRFGLSSCALSRRAKQLRHQLCAAVDELGIEMLIVSRDADGDVGRQMCVDGQLRRTNLRDCFVAAAKRLTEALRVLAEATQTFNPSAAQRFEQLRFTAYTLEKDVLIFSSVSEKLSSVGLYVIITATESTGNSAIIELAKNCAAGGADCIQLRAKGMTDERLFAISRELVKVCESAGVVSIINDRVDIAALVGADGVHLGQNDLAVSQCRRLQLVPMIFGLSTHSIDQLKVAIAERADYVGLGPVFATGTKPDADTAGLKYITEATGLLADTDVFHVAIGGITPGNIDQVLKAGAKAVAVCSAVADSEAPKAVCQKFKDKIMSNR